ncbi:MAG: hypothetical protein AAB446_02350 [Patescibacteria group bacterium]
MTGFDDDGVAFESDDEFLDQDMIDFYEKNPELSDEDLLNIHLTKIGFQKTGVDYIISKITQILEHYEDPLVATAVLSQKFIQTVKSLFSEKQFKHFLSEIDPLVISKHELFMNGYEPFLDGEKQSMSRIEINEFEQEKRKFITQRQTERKKNLGILSNPENYQILTTKNFREMKEPLGLSVPPIKTLSSPMGGQSGYRKRFRRK